MQPVHARYTYRHGQKTRRMADPHQRVSEPRTIPDQTMRQLAGRSIEQEERERVLPELALAERYLSILGQTAQREYEAAADNIALRRNNLGIQNLERGELTRAFRNFREAIHRDPTFGLAHNNLGLLYLEIGDHDRAIHHFNIAVGLGDGLDTAHGNRALAWIELGDYGKAYDDLDRDDPNHYNNMGVLFLEIGEFQLAGDFFRESIRLDPERALHHSNLGMTHREMGELNQANESFMTAAAISNSEFEESMAGTDA